MIFATDRATFNSPEYMHAFKGNQKYFINAIPLFIYWNDIAHKIIDAGGRNSLDLAPTILDILRIYNCENYFLGSALFVENGNNFSKISVIGDEFYYTGRGKAIPITEDSTLETKLLYEYYGVTLNHN